jgi:guanine nucleotide exchange factor for rab-3A
MNQIDSSSSKSISENDKTNTKDSQSCYSSPMSSSERLSNEKDSECTGQDKIWEEAKLKMDQKFDKLEKEIGIKLMQKQKLDEDLDNASSETESASTPISSSSSLNFSSEKGFSLSSSKLEDHSLTRLEQELKKSQQNLKLKDEEIAKLSRIRTQVESELEDLTVSLFEEANNMVRNANVLRAKSERDCKEALMKIDVLQAEVEALKMLVITSTPSAPNFHLHPHLDTKNGLKSNL